MLSLFAAVMNLRDMSSSAEESGQQGVRVIGTGLRGILFVLLAFLVGVIIV